MKTINQNWKVMADPVNKKLHPLHENRYIVTENSKLYTWLTENELHWELSEGSIICKMRDLPDQKETAKHISKTPEYYKAIKLFLSGWDHFLDCMNFANSPMDAEAIAWMNEISLTMRNLND